MKVTSRFSKVSWLCLPTQWLLDVLGSFFSANCLGVQPLLGFPVLNLTRAQRCGVCRAGMARTRTEQPFQPLLLVAHSFVADSAEVTAPAPLFIISAHMSPGPDTLTRSTDRRTLTSSSSASWTMNTWRAGHLHSGHFPVLSENATLDRSVEQKSYRDRQGGLSILAQHLELPGRILAPISLLFLGCSIRRY